MRVIAIIASLALAAQAEAGHCQRVRGRCGLPRSYDTAAGRRSGVIASQTEVPQGIDTAVSPAVAGGNPQRKRFVFPEPALALDHLLLDQLGATLHSDGELQVSYAGSTEEGARREMLHGWEKMRVSEQLAVAVISDTSSQRPVSAVRCSYFGDLPPRRLGLSEGLADTGS